MSVVSAEQYGSTIIDFFNVELGEVVVIDTSETITHIQDGYGHRDVRI